MAKENIVKMIQDCGWYLNYFLKVQPDKEVEEQIGINRRTFKMCRQRYGVTVEKRKKGK